MKISPCKPGSELVQRPGSRSLPIPCHQYRHPPLLKLHVPGLRCLVQAICCHALVPSRSQPTVPFELMMLRATSMKPAAAARVSSRRQVKIQAISRDASGSSLTQKVATGALAALVAAGALLPAPVMAADLALGKQVFEGNCAACHSGGNNSVIPDHTLKKAAIEQFLTGGLTLEAIQYQVENGKAAMPAWEGTLDDDEIVAVSNYVYDQAVNDKW